jgi:hypothetical protein
LAGDLVAVLLFAGARFGFTVTLSVI